MKTMAGALAFACSNRSRTRAASTPTNTTKSEPEIEKNVAGLRRMTARASSVFAGAGRRSEEQHFLGIFAPIAWNFAGFCR